MLCYDLKPVFENFRIIRDYIKYENAKCEAEKKEAKQNVAAANKKVFLNYARCFKHQF